MFILVLMIAIGALIGGFTNYLAIKMLFRPYKTYYIGKWRIPFTPGVIPSRRGELAVQLGKMVVEHLLTPESIKKKFLNKGFQTEILQLILKELTRLKTSSKTPVELLEKFGISNAGLQLELKVDSLIAGAYEKFITKNRDKPIKMILSPELVAKVDGKMPMVSQYILSKGIDYFSSVEGKLRIQRMLDDFLSERGKLGNMLQMLLGNVNLVDKIQPEVIKFLTNKGSEETLTAILKTEWNKVIDWDIQKLEEQFEKRNLLSFIKDSVWKLIKVEVILNKPIKDIELPISVAAMESIITNVLDVFGAWLSDKIEVLLERLHLKEVVREQVESFSVDRLEKLVLSIIQSELRMITYLGCILGGVIGLFQGFIMLFLN